jgi:hypothetical protein
VVEADGSQDIGQDYGMLEPGSGSQDGTALDFWFSGNPAPVYLNEFSTRTHPPALSNAGADPHLVMSAFSARGPRMTVQAARGSASFSPVTGFPMYLGAAMVGGGVSFVSSGAPAAPVLFITSGVTPAGPVENTAAPPVSVQSAVRAFTLAGTPALPSGGPSGVVTTHPGDRSYAGPAAIRELTGDGQPEIAVAVPRSSAGPGYVSVTTLASTLPGDTLGSEVMRIALDRVFATPAVLADTLVAVVDDLDSLYLFGRTGAPRGALLVPFLDGERVAGLSGSTGQAILTVTGNQGTLVTVAVTPSGPEVQRLRRVGRQIVGPASTVAVGRGGDAQTQFGFATSDGFVYLVGESLDDRAGFPVRLGDSVSAPPAFADLNGDGSRDIIAFSGRTIHAISSAGSSLDYFPVTVTGTSPLASNPVVGDLSGAGVSSVLGVTREGLVVAYDAQGKTAPGFPLLAGRGPHTAAIIGRPDSVFVAVASAGDGSLSLWRTGSRAATHQDAADWAQYQGDASQYGVQVTAISGMPVTAEYFPPSRAYNWPNPAYDGRTFIRYFVGEPSAVHIKIFDTAGDLVKEMSGPGVGGVDNEVEWDVRDVQSGVYFARIEAQSGGQTGSAIVKIAIVK